MPRIAAGIAACRLHFTAKIRTIFEDPHIELDNWLPAFRLISGHTGISSHELHRAVGLTQKTAWFMLHHIREAMKSDDADMLTGIVETDETYIGGTWENKPKSKPHVSA